MIMIAKQLQRELSGMPMPGVGRDRRSWSFIRGRYFADQRKIRRASAAFGGRPRKGCKIDVEEIKKRRRETVHRTGAAPFVELMAQKIKCTNGTNVC